MIPIRDSIPCYHRPVVTWTLIAINVAVFVIMLSMSAGMKQTFVFLYGLVAARYSHPEWAVHMGFSDDHYLSFVTSMFLHAGWMHIIMNMLFMWIFADNIEDRMGRLRFVAFYFLCGLTAAFLQYYFNSDSTVPVIGASGAIAGILGAYFFLYPYARIIIWIPLFFLPIFFEVPAIAFLGFWVIIQLMYVTDTIVNQTVADVAWWGHLGGFLMGAVSYRFFLLDDRPEPGPESGPSE